MKKYPVFGSLLLVICQNAFGDSFLTAQQFPKTFQDLSFSERVIVIKEGFEPYQSEFDANGVCIKNCAYNGITIKQEQERSARDTENALAESARYAQSQNLPVDTRNIVSVINNDIQSPTCTNRNPSVTPGQGVPYGEPLIGSPVISSKYDLQRWHPI